MTISEYFNQVKNQYNSKIATEHSYRAYLINLIESLVTGINVTNEPKRQECGAPDYIITKKKIPIGYIEAKDIGVDLNKIEKSEQLSRYKESLDNLILTDYIEFRFFKHKEKVLTINIGHYENNKLKPNQDEWSNFENLIKDFCSYIGQTITSAETLSKMMANKARLMKNVIHKALITDTDGNTSLMDQFNTFKKILIHDMNEETFADIYAQTIAYGLFAARLHDKTLEDFSRLEAMSLVPKSNPFLRRLFSYIAGPDLDERIIWVVDELADVFRACNVKNILSDFGSATQQNDPMIHFYETFLAEYDPKLRKSRGVYYTPEPVVNFIVRAVDDILKTEFDLPDGLADTSTTKIKVESQKMDKRTKSRVKMVEQEVHKVQILDPATGTGTFLSEVIKQIYKRFQGQKGIWSNYVEEHLIPRIHGFEILMASYAMCHLKLEILLAETGYKPKNQKRLQVYLTNSLEEFHKDTGTLFASWLSQEASEANHIKKETPVMCIMGNPPYNAMSKNQGNWIMNLMKDYKMEPGGKEKLKERNPKMLNDDYVKFIRYSQHFIEKNGEGVLAFINPHGFLDSDTFRGMRWHLLKTYDKIYSIDLHGNTKKKEVTKDGIRDENVFDITQGVSINIFVKNTLNNDLGEIYYYSQKGKRETKYDFLYENSLSTIKFEKITYKNPNYFFIPKDLKKLDKYEELISLKDLFNFVSTGMQTDKDNFCIQLDKKFIQNIFSDLKNLNNQTIREKYNLGDDTSSWNLVNAINDIKSHKTNIEDICHVQYRPFDIRYTYYTGESNGFMGRPRSSLVKHVNTKRNLSLITIKNSRSKDIWNLIFVSKLVCSKPTTITSLDANYILPLYLYENNTEQQNLIESVDRVPNLNQQIIDQIAQKLNLTFTTEKNTSNDTFAPIDILDYIYGILHCSNYRLKYDEYLKIDFPRIPYPENKGFFIKFVEKGKELRKLHLMESPALNKLITTFPNEGDNKVEKIKFEDDKKGKVWINKSQYFDKVPKIAWEFYIGGYQPAQKWLKDRKGQELSFDDIKHYQKIIVALNETDRIMKEIDNIHKF